MSLRQGSQVPDQAAAVGVAVRSWRAGIAIAVVLTAVAVTLRFADLTSQSLWFDEGFSVTLSSGRTLSDVWAHLASAVGSERYQPFYYVVLWGWRTLLGSSEWTLRALSVVLACAAVLAIGGCAWRTYGRAHALWALALAAVASCAIYYSQEARPYSLMLLLGALQVWAFLEVARGGDGSGRLAQWVLWLSAAIGFATSVLLVLFTVSIGLADILVRRDLRAAIRLWWPLGLAAGAATLFYGSVSLSQQAGNISTLSGPVVRNAVFVIYGLLAGTTYGPPLEDLHALDVTRTILAYWPSLAALATILLILALTTLRGLFWGSRSRTVERADQILVVVLAAGFCLDLAFAVVSRLNWLPRHSLYLLVPLLLLLPAAVRPRAGDPAARWRAERWLGVAAIVALMAVNLYSVGHYYFDTRYARDDYRGAAAYLEHAQADSIPSVLLWGNPDLLAYYGDRSTIDGRTLAKADISDEIWRVTGASPQVAVAINRDFYWDPRGIVALDAAMASRYELTAAVSLPYFAIQTYRLRAAPATP